MLPKSRLPDAVSFPVTGYARVPGASVVSITVAQQDRGGRVVGVGTLEVPVAEVDTHVRLHGLEAGITACVESRMPRTR